MFKLLDALLSPDATVQERCRVLQDEFHIPMTQTLESEVTSMCNLSQGVEERGIKKGIEKGRTEGRAEGILTSIRCLMDSMGWTVEQAMSALKISDEERPKYSKLLNS